MSEIKDSIIQANQQRQTSHRFAKAIFLAAMSFALIALDWWLLNQALMGSKPLASWIWVAITTMAWISFISFFVMVSPHKWIFVATNIWSLVIYLIIMPKDLYVIIGGLLFFLLSLLFERRIETEGKNQLHFSIRRTISASVQIATFAFLFVIGFNLYYSISADFKQDPEGFYDRIGRATAKSVPFLYNTFPGANLDQTLDDYLGKKAEGSLPQEIQQGPESVKQSYIAEYKKQFLNNLGITSQDNETIAAVLTQLLEQRSRDLFGRYERFFPLIFTLVIVALLKTFSFIFNWLTIFVSWLFFQILLATKFFRISKATVEVDKLEV